jgi:glycine dehydrogenase
MALALLKPPGEMGADFVLGNSQRFGVPLGYGGPHAAFFAVKDEHKRRMPGRLIGVSKDANGQLAYRLALQTREQHIRREKATSNICTAQALLANMASLFAVYHGPEGIKEIAQRIHNLTAVLAHGIEHTGQHQIVNKYFFDTLLIKLGHPADELLNSALKKKINIRKVDKEHVSITLDETVTKDDLFDLLVIFGTSSFEEQYKGGISRRSELCSFDLEKLAESIGVTLASPAKKYPEHLSRKSAYLTHPVFNSYHSETDMLRYITYLQSKDLSLANAMIPLGSCTMKLNATAEMIPVTWPEFGNIHPFVPLDQAKGYQRLFKVSLFYFFIIHINEIICRS